MIILKPFSVSLDVSNSVSESHRQQTKKKIGSNPRRQGEDLNFSQFLQGFCDAYTLSSCNLMCSLIFHVF